MIDGADLKAIAWALRLAQVTAACLLFGGALFPFYTRTCPRMPAGVMFVSAAALFLGAAASCAAEIVSLTGETGSIVSFPELRAFFFDTSFGPVWAVRLALGAGLLALTAVWLVAQGGGHRYRLRLAVAAGFSGAVLVTFAAGGHASAVPDAQRAMAAMTWQGVHLLLAGAWMGGLVPLSGLLRQAGRDARMPIATEAVHRFSTFAIPGVAGLLICGAMTIVVLAASWNATAAVLAASAYGSILAIKLALIAMLVLLAAVNRMWLVPRLPEPRALRQLRVSIGLEVVLAVAVLASAVTLSRSSPPEKANTMPSQTGAAMR